ncbi:hypothetical protein [Spirillospora sp. CA-128828]|uniref:hypothetical protein n=1 Tax=Spirillospora sp. CA-128828 TaxID=3240033 RepID=UPI003D92D70B
MNMLAVGVGAAFALSGCGIVDRATADDHYVSETDPCPPMKSVALELLGSGAQDDPGILKGQDCGWKVDTTTAKPTTPQEISWGKFQVALVVFRADGMISGEKLARLHHEKLNNGNGSFLKCPKVPADCLYESNPVLGWVTVRVRDRNRIVEGRLEPLNGVDAKFALYASAEVPLLGKALAAVP